MIPSNIPIFNHFNNYVGDASRSTIHRYGIGKDRLDFNLWLNPDTAAREVWKTELSVSHLPLKEIYSITRV